MTDDTRNADHDPRPLIEAARLGHDPLAGVEFPAGQPIITVPARKPFSATATGIVDDMEDMLDEEDHPGPMPRSTLMREIAAVLIHRAAALDRTPRKEERQ